MIELIKDYALTSVHSIPWVHNRVTHRDMKARDRTGLEAPLVKCAKNCVVEKRVAGALFHFE